METWRFWKWHWTFPAIYGAFVVIMAIVVALAINFPDGLPS